MTDGLRPSKPTVGCLCGETLATENEFETHIDSCPQIGTELWDAINERWAEVRTHKTLCDFVKEVGI